MQSQSHDPPNPYGFGCVGMAVVSLRQSKVQADEVRREGVLATHVRDKPGPFDPASLARSYALGVDRVRQIIRSNGGSCG